MVALSKHFTTVSKGNGSSEGTVMAQSVKPTLPDELTDRQKLFCLQYLTDLNATKAAIRSGYTKRSARQQGAKLLAKPRIREFLSDSTAAKCNEAGLTATWVLRCLKSTIDSCLQERPVTDGDGNQVMVENGEGELCAAATTIDSANALRGLEMAARYLQLFSGEGKQSSSDDRPRLVFSAEMDARTAATEYRKLMAR